MSRQHAVDGKHKELDLFGLSDLENLVKEWNDPYRPPEVVNHEGVLVVRDDLIPGSKVRFADLLFQGIKQDTVVYVQPRFGLASWSILHLAERYRKRVVLFMPACARVSAHQAAVIERGAEPRFLRIAAVPNLVSAAREWCSRSNAFFLPLGLAHQTVVASAMRVSRRLLENGVDPDVVFCATSTGTLIRGLQLGWSRARCVAVTITRTMKAGELGRAEPLTESLDRHQPERACPPPYPSVATFDSKAWKHALSHKQNHPRSEVLLWNVGRDIEPRDPFVYDRVDSFREWEDKSDLLLK